MPVVLRVNTETRLAGRWWRKIDVLQAHGLRAAEPVDADSAWHTGG
ncbi:MAG: hypothetical protein ACR2NO_09025 [Chloroflexota bacterium]